MSRIIFFNQILLKMKNNRHSVFALKCLGAAFILMSQHAQAQRDSLYQDIEMVKISKLLPKQKEKIETTNTDFLSHDAGKFLNSIPELSGIRKAGSYATDPVLRGFKYEQLNLITDGAANAINACPNRMDPASSQISMNIVKEAEVYKGPYFFRYGSALGGTINFKSFDPEFTEDLKFDGRLSTGFESNGSVIRNELSGTLHSKNLVWDLFGSYQKGNRYKDGDGVEVPSRFERYNFGTKGNFKWNDQHLTTLQVNSNQGRDIEFAALKMDLIYDKTWMVQLKHAAKYKDQLLEQVNLNSFMSFVDHSMATPDLKMIHDVKSKTAGARGELKFRKDQFNFYTGLDYKYEFVETLELITPPTMKPRDGTAWQDSEIQQVGWFNEFNYYATYGKFMASLRLDYNTGKAKEESNLFRQLYGDTKEDQLNHSLSAGYSHYLDKNSQLSLWLGSAQRSASVTERFINLFVIGLDTYEILGNPHLKAETNNQMDLIYTYKRENVYFQVNGFYAYLQDYISGVINPNIAPYSKMSPGVRQMMNVEKAFKTGIESTFHWQFTPKYKTELAMAYTYAEDLTTKNPLPEIAPLDFRWSFIADFNPVKAALKYRFVSEQSRIDKAFGELETPSFNLFDIDLTYDVFKNAVLIGSVSNIFDKAYAEHLSRALSTDLMKRIYAPGRSFNLAFSYRF